MPQAESGLYFAQKMTARRCGLLVALMLGIACVRERPDAGEGFVEVPGGKVFYRVVGSSSATPLLLVHGGPGFGSCSFASIAALGSTRPVVMYDQLGAGRSDRPKDADLWRIERFVEELASVRRALGLHRVHLLGQSWGAAIVAEYLITKHPAGIESVI